MTLIDLSKLHIELPDNTGDIYLSFKVNNVEKFESKGKPLIISCIMSYLESLTMALQSEQPELLLHAQRFFMAFCYGEIPFPVIFVDELCMKLAKHMQGSKNEKKIEAYRECINFIIAHYRDSYTLGIPEIGVKNAK